MAEVSCDNPPTVKSFAEMGGAEIFQTGVSVWSAQGEPSAGEDAYATVPTAAWSYFSSGCALRSSSGVQKMLRSLVAARTFATAAGRTGAALLLQVLRT